MDRLRRIILMIILALTFFFGNFPLINAVCGSEPLDWSSDWEDILLIIMADLILLFFVMAKIVLSVRASFPHRRKELRNRRAEEKEYAKFKKLLESEKLDLNRFQALIDKRISESATKRTLHFCQLMEIIAGKEQFEDCLFEVKERQSVLDEINDIENGMLKAAKSCKKAGKIEKCIFYLEILKASRTTPEIAALEQECEMQVYLRIAKMKAIRFWIIVILGTIAYLGFRVYCLIY